VRASAAAWAGLALFVSCRIAVAADCAAKSPPAEQIRCLEETVVALREQVEKLSAFVRDNETLTEAHLRRLELLMEHRIRQATEPSIHHPF